MDMNPAGTVSADSNLLKKLPANWGIEWLRSLKCKPEQQIFEGINGLGLPVVLRQQTYQPLRERLWHTLSQFSLPHVGQVIACSCVDGNLYTLERHYKGETLLNAVNGGRRLGKRQIIKSMWNINQDLATLYSQAGLLHLDIKPDNFMIDTYGNVTLLDFGAAYAAVEAIDFSRVPQYGTPTYAAPERYHAPNLVGPATDLYSLSEVLKWWLSAEGQLDFRLWTAIDEWQQFRSQLVESIMYGTGSERPGIEAYDAFEQLLYQGLL